MFGREFQAGKHRQHIVPSPPTGYGFEVIGSRKEAAFNEQDTTTAPGFTGEAWEGTLGGGEDYHWEVTRDSDGALMASGIEQDTVSALVKMDEILKKCQGLTASRTAAVQWEEDSLMSPSPDGGKTRYWTAFPDGASEDDLTSFANVSEITPNLFRWVVLGPYGETIAEGEETSLDAAKVAAEGALMSGQEFQAGSRKEASRQETASYHLAFFDGFDIPEPRHRVAGWDWDDHLNGFLAAEAAREFTCACGESVPAPGYTDCRCGRRWNAYTIQANGSKKMIAREVPVRDGVVMAGRTASRVAAYEEDDGYTSPEAGDSIEVHSGGSYFEVLYDKRIGDHKFRATNGQEFYVDSIVSINEDRVDPDKIRLEASRKQASSELYDEFEAWAHEYNEDPSDPLIKQEYADMEGVSVEDLKAPDGVPSRPDLHNRDSSRKQADAFYPGDKVSLSPGGEQATVIRWDPVVGYVQIRWDDGRVVSLNEGMLFRASRKQAESGAPKFREGDMVIGRGPDMNTHTLREVGSVVEQDGGYFYRLRKLHGSGPGGSRLYAEEHLEGYRLQR